MNKLRQYVLNLLIAIDELASALLGGDPKETISSRLGKSQRGDYGLWWKRVLSPAVWFVNTIFWVVAKERNHCTINIDDDEGEYELLL